MIIEARNIRKSFGSLEVLKGVDIAIDRGEIVSIVGTSGAGKTTLLQILGTLDRADSGELRIDGTDIMGMNNRKQAEFRNRRLGFIFQFHRLLPEFTALENVMIPALIAGKSRKEASCEAERLLSDLNLSDRASHKPSELSGGEKQRIAVARALVNHPAIILADEPSGSLDSAHKEELHALFFRLCREMGQTFLIVTHDEKLAAGTDRILHMRDGLLFSE
ncbi:ABC-type antimicrobial peptide transport system, ATPase component [Porphyromonas gingivalis AJW4]|uniref:Lipoprotein-releasing system ATP-binding protein LolD n=4 Tax=Porphyromonas gingivalis TaxID=837 RepID=LOLD_PORGI|nr:ABC transporter ATP-binding protein [Porphyromonas gingivalis]Q7MU65.1 RecName: Full=Lipoprotein-releasing system ATP-binding protein LolD [Porphyromonas gingivalis W83]AAQ66706.1 ABC transporter, ATP-binding protein [Porphyromonas gingivalis W83]AIJ35492.1 lipoprotein ABC transporter ATP-binding protein [Porphyromonas gingivalis]AKV63542.1 ABC-type antimicrobial peptide transport system, ATPase component [Porphyromonas gingivalis]ALA92985.1 ABC-type antimicrobial peptide transport system, 